jgi:nifR3 family TIM-barrel protein
MEDVTDSSFRTICKQYDADVLVTEFVSAEGLAYDAVKSKDKMIFGEEERPIGIQIFGPNIESMVKATIMSEQNNPDFIDINFGCPVRKVVNKGGGAALLNDLPKMIKMTTAVVKATKIPVTVKTRLGWNEQSKNIVDIAERLQDEGIQAISIHGRTRAQLYGGQADWSLIGAVKNNIRMKIPVFGNGDITGAIIAREMKDRYGVDGLMIGRAAIGNPWIFREIKAYLERGELIPPPSLEERLRIIRLHIARARLIKGDMRANFELRKFYSGYLRGLPDIKKYRMKMVMAKDLEEIGCILKELEGVSE